MKEENFSEQTLYWRDSRLSNLEMLRATFVTHAFNRHAHDEYAIGVIERGVEAFEYRRQTHFAQAGQIVMVNPGEIHNGQAGTPQGWSYRMFYPPSELLQQAATELTGRPRDVPFFRPAVVWDAEVAQQLSRFHLELEQPGDLLERQSRLLTTLIRLVARYADDSHAPRPVGVEDRAVEQVRQYLTDNYDQPITLDELSQVAHLSQFHLLRVFRRETGLPPHIYLNQVRLNRAKRLLQQGRPIVQVALETGFVDQSHFTRQFKRTLGVTPGQYNSKIVQ